MHKPSTTASGMPRTPAQWERLRRMNSRGRWLNPPARERMHFGVEITEARDHWCTYRARHTWRTGQPAISLRIPRGATLRHVLSILEDLGSFIENYWATLLVEPAYIARLDAAWKREEEI